MPVIPSPPPLPGSDEATRSARSDSLSLPLRVSNLCELLVFVKNLELSVTAEPPPQMGTKYVTSGITVAIMITVSTHRHAPYVCPMGEALVVK